MDLGLDQKIFLVTGGAKGIGEGITRALAQEGAIPVILGRNEKDNISLVEELHTLGLKAAQFPVELSEQEQCAEVIHKIMQKYDRIDGIVNNAGVNDGV